MYEENGKVASQSLAVARYIGKKINLAGDDEWQNLEIDSVADTLTDLRLSKKSSFILKSLENFNYFEKETVKRIQLK